MPSSLRIFFAGTLFCVLCSGQAALTKTIKKARPKKSSDVSSPVSPKKKSTNVSPTKPSTVSTPTSEKPISAKMVEPDTTTPATHEAETPEGHESRNRFGVAASILSNDMVGTYTHSNKNYTATMRGRGYGLVGFYDHFFSGPFSGRLMAGFEQFSVAVNQYALTCDGGKSTICSVDLTNLSVYAQGRVTVVPGKLPVWVAGGIGGWVPLVKKSTVFDSSSIGPMLVFVISAGVDIPLFGQKLPIFADYVYLSGSATVTGSSLIGRIGYSWK